MTEERLKRWLRGELPPAERKEVSRWVVRCTDPRLGDLLAGMSAEATHAAADASLAGRSPLWASLVGAWDALLDAGRARISGLDAPTIRLAGLDTEAPRPILAFEAADAGPALRVEPSGGAEQLTVLTDDQGRVQVLHGPERDTPSLLLPLPGSRGPRAVFWVLRADRLPEGVVDVGWLASALVPGLLEAHALREETP